MDEKTIEQLVTCRALLLFLYNFKSEDIEELCKNSDFKYNWDKMCSKRKNKSFVEFTVFYDMFSTQLMYETQGVVLQRVIQRYETEARNAIEFSQKISVVRNEVKQRNL